MSYEQAFNKSSKQQLFANSVDTSAAGDEESLLSGQNAKKSEAMKQYEDQCERMEKSLESFSFKLKSLEKYSNMIGTPSDNHMIRNQMNLSLDECLKLMQDSEVNFQQFSKFNNSSFPPQYNKRKDQQMKAFSDTFQNFGRRFRQVSLDIQNKQSLFPLQNSASEAEELQRKEQQEESKQQMQMAKLKKIQTIKISAETDQMSDLLTERKEQIDKINKIMLHINQIAKDINVETHAQGEKLVNVNGVMGKTADNTSAAVKELQEAQIRSQRSYKLLGSLLLGTIFVLVIVILQF